LWNVDAQDREGRAAHEQRVCWQVFADGFKYSTDGETWIPYGTGSDTKQDAVAAWNSESSAAPCVLAEPNVDGGSLSSTILMTNL
jgi:hypothetical protein